MIRSEVVDTADNNGRDRLLDWSVLTIDELSARELLAIVKLRVDVFVVEQACAYPEVDEMDASPDTMHLLVKSGSEVIATARAIAPETACPALAEEEDTAGSTALIAAGAAAVQKAARIGRVAVHPSHRGRGLARLMMIRLMHEIAERFGTVDIVLGAQTVVVDLYLGLGFKVTSEAYLEDGIEHVDMRYQPTDATGKTFSD